MDTKSFNYLKLADKRIRFLINFNVPLLKHGFRRYVNKLWPVDGMAVRL